MAEAAAGGTVPDANVEALVAHQAATRTYAADLQQVFHWTFPRRHVESTGRFYYQAPDRVALLLTNPVPETVLVRGTDLYVQRDRKPAVHRILQVRNGRPTENIQFLLAFFQNGCTNYTKLFQAQMARTDDTLTVTLTPRNRSRLFPLRTVTNVLSWPGCDVQTMRIGLVLDSFITYEFHNAVRNQPLDQAVFALPNRQP